MILNFAQLAGSSDWWHPLKCLLSVVAMTSGSFEWVGCQTVRGALVFFWWIKNQLSQSQYLIIYPYIYIYQESIFVYIYICNLPFFFANINIYTEYTYVYTHIRLVPAIRGFRLQLGLLPLHYSPRTLHYSPRTLHYSPRTLHNVEYEESTRTRRV